MVATTSAKAPATVCRNCGGMKFDPRQGQVIRREIAGIDERTGIEYRAIEWIPVKCAKCGSFRKIRTLIPPLPKKKAASKKLDALDAPKVATTHAKRSAPTSRSKNEQKSAPTFVHLGEKSDMNSEPIVSIPKVTPSSDYASAQDDAQQSSKDSRAKRKAAVRRN